MVNGRPGFERPFTLNKEGMESITLQRVLPCVFAGEAAPRDSGVWSQEVTFRKGEYCLLEAASGTGKTSLCHFLYGIREDYAGRILFDGADCRGFSAAAWSALRRRSLSMLSRICAFSAN